MRIVSDEASSERRIEPAAAGGRSSALWIYALAVVLGLLLMEFLGGLAYTAAALMIGLAVLEGLPLISGRSSRRATRVDGRDVVAIVVIYALVVVLYRIAFVGISGNDMLLFLLFAAGLLVGSVGPIFYTVWVRGRSLVTLGLTTRDLPRTVMLALVFAAVQFSITLLGYDLPGARGWVTLLGMALVVGAFESIFFRGFVQGRLQASFGSTTAVFGAALLYGAYHVGYGMDLEESAFLFGLGIIYALAYATTNSLLILWPLLTPLGSLFAQLEGGELVGRLPWASLLGFADVMAVMVAVIWLARRRERKGYATAQASDEVTLERRVA